MHRVYVVEDDPQIRLLVARILENAGLQVRTFYCAEEASDALQDQPPDLLVADIGLPLASGVDLRGFVRDMAPGTKVLFMSGHGPGELERRGLEKGAAFLQKPFNGDKLRRAVMALLGTGPDDDVPHFGEDPAEWAPPWGRPSVA